MQLQNTRRTMRCVCMKPNKVCGIEGPRTWTTLAVTRSRRRRANSQPRVPITTATLCRSPRGSFGTIFAAQRNISYTSGQRCRCELVSLHVAIVGPLTRVDKDAEALDRRRKSPIMRMGDRISESSALRVFRAADHLAKYQAR